MAIKEKRKVTTRKPPPKRRLPISSPKLKDLPSATPAFVEPMKALAKTSLPGDNGWSLELKLDGIRAIAIRDGNNVKIFSRRPRDITRDYPAIVEGLRELSVSRWVVDGEIVALDEQGRSSFQLLQNRDRSHATNPIILYLFDVINLEGRDLRMLPLSERQRLLKTLLRKPPKLIRISETLDAPAKKVWKHIVRLRLEGIIAKRVDSEYEAGRRSGAWIKVKAQQQQEFVIGGYTPPEGSRKFFGSLAVGYYESGKLLYASRVGTGFDFTTLKSLHQLFQKFRVSTCPFINLPTRRKGRFGQGMSASEMRACVWLKPQLVCQVRFLEWTGDDNLRQPVFLGLREDKSDKEVVRERSGSVS